MFADHCDARLIKLWRFVTAFLALSRGANQEGSVNYVVSALGGSGRLCITFCATLSLIIHDENEHELQKCFCELGFLFLLLTVH